MKAYRAFQMDYKVTDDSAYEYEDMINQRIGIRPSTICDVYETNRVYLYCGRGRFPIVPYQTQIQILQAHTVLITNNIKAALDALRTMNPRTLLVDNEFISEKGLQQTTCMSMVSMDHPEATIYYGPEVSHHEHHIYNLLRSMGTINVSWDDRAESAYPRGFDAQHHWYELTGQKQIKLRDYARVMHTAKKVNHHHKARYDTFDISRISIDYALTDAMVLKQAYQQRAGAPTDEVIIKLGMVAYAVDSDIALQFDHLDLTYCDRQFQAISVNTLKSLIALEVGWDVDIVDCGSGPEIGVFERQGTACVPQAIYESVRRHPNAIGRKLAKKIDDLRADYKMDALAGAEGLRINLSPLLKTAIRRGGVGL